MSTALQKHSTTDIAPASFTPEQVDLIKRTIAKGATDDELALFIATAKRLGLDPFARQIFAVKYGSTMSIQVSIDGFRLAADRSGRYAPGRPTEYVHEDGQLVCATAYVKKLAGDQWHEIGECAYLAEYSKSTNSLWKTMPRVMLAKCAEARALRRAFPAELSGAYSPEEMDQGAAEFPRSQTLTYGSPAPAAETVEIDELAWQLRVSAAANIEELKALKPEFSALPDGIVKQRIADVIQKRGTALAREYAAKMKEAAHG